MTEIPAMMLWTDAYLGDTSHLTTLEHGAYLLILMAMWRAGGVLPNEELRLARTARLSLDKWRRVAPTIMTFMKVADGNVSQKRLKLEFEIASGRHEKLVKAGKAGGRAKALRNLAPQPSNAKLLPAPSPERGSSLPEPLPKEEEKNLTVLCPKPVRTRAEYPDDFLEFWAAYPTDSNMGKKEAYAEWQKLSAEDRVKAIRSCPAFSAYCRSHPDYRPIHANRYLAKGRFEGHSATAAVTSAFVFVRIGTREWDAWDAHYRRTKNKSPPVNKEGTGWNFPSLIPGHMAEAS